MWVSEVNRFDLPWPRSRAHVDCECTNWSKELAVSCTKSGSCFCIPHKSMKPSSVSCNHFLRQSELWNFGQQMCQLLLRCRQFFRYEKFGDVHNGKTGGISMKKWFLTEILSRTKHDNEYSQRAAEIDLEGRVLCTPALDYRTIASDKWTSDSRCLSWWKNRRVPYEAHLCINDRTPLNVVRLIKDAFSFTCVQRAGLPTDGQTVMQSADHLSIRMRAS